MDGVLVFASVLLTGLSSGLFVGWSVSVVPGTRRSSDRSYVEVMQHINRAIVNPLFLLIFMGSALILVITAIVLFAGDHSRRAWWVAASAVTYIAGMLGVTIGGNIPLNNELDRFDLGAANDSTLRERRVGYERPWNRWHYVRSSASIVSFAFVVVAALTSPED